MIACKVESANYYQKESILRLQRQIISNYAMPGLVEAVTRKLTDSRDRITNFSNIDLTVAYVIQA